MTAVIVPSAASVMPKERSPRCPLPHELMTRLKQCGLGEPQLLENAPIKEMVPCTHGLRYEQVDSSSAIISLVLGPCVGSLALPGPSKVP